MNLSGQLSDWSIHDLLQIMQVTKKTGSLDIEGARRGRIHFRDGAVTGAELTGSRGTYKGEDRGTIADILYVLSTLDSGSFSVGPADGPQTGGLSVEEVLSDLDALRHLEGEVVDAGLFEAAGIRIRREIDQPITINPEDWHAFATLVQPFSFANLEAQVGRGGAVRLVHTLHRLGVAEPVDHLDDETTLLVNVAGSIASETAWLDRAATENRPAERAAEEPRAVERQPEPEPQPQPEPEVPAAKEPERQEPLGVAAPASITLTDGVYDEIRRLRSKVAER